MNLHCIEDEKGEHYIRLDQICMLESLNVDTSEISILFNSGEWWMFGFMELEKAQEEHAKLVSLLTEKDLPPELMHLKEYIHD